MLNKEPEPGREQLGFKEAVLTSFKFLNDAGLHPVAGEMTLVRYESSVVFVNVYHGRVSFELGVEIGRLREPSKALTLYDIVAWAGAEKAEGFANHVMFQVSSRKDVQEFAGRLASLIRKYAGPFLRGDDSAFDSAFEVRAERWQREMKQGNLSNIRSRAEAAWQAKNYVQVIKYYSSMHEDLSHVESKRLDYAERQVVIVRTAEKRSSNQK